MFIPKAKRAKRLSSSTDKTLTTVSKVDASSTLSTVKSDVGNVDEVSGLLLFPVDVAASSSERDEATDNILPYAISIVATISLILMIFGRRLKD